MPRTFPAGFYNDPRRCVGVKIVRGDGVIFGLTDCNVPITSGGVLYWPQDGVSLSALMQESGTSNDAATIMSVLNDALNRVTRVDLLSSHYEKSRVWVYEINWATGAQVIMGQYRLAKATVGDTMYQAEMPALLSYLANTTGEIYQVACPCHFGDQRCDPGIRTCVLTAANSATQHLKATAGITAGDTLFFMTAGVNRVVDHIVDSTHLVLTSAVSTTLYERVIDRSTQTLKSSRTFSRTVTAVTDSFHFTLGSDTHATDYFTNGTLAWTSGNNVNIPGSDVKKHTLVSGAAVIILNVGTPLPIQVGDTCNITFGCSGLASICKTVPYNSIVNPSGTNIENFRGVKLPAVDTIRQVGR